MKKRRWRMAWLVALASVLCITLWPTLARSGLAHAVVVHSEPAANARLNASPAELRIWFTEPLEPEYSSIELRDATGALVATPPSFVDAADAMQLVLMTGELDEGLYTVVWRNVSSADGHRQTGSFPFVIGAGEAEAAGTTGMDIALAPFDVLARGANFLGLALALGSIAFVVMVWQPAMSHHHNGIPRGLWWLVWAGWLLAGMGALLLLWNQVAILLNMPAGEVLEVAAIVDVLTSTRFGALWLWRMALWVVMGVLLLLARHSQSGAWLATACAFAMLLIVSLYSHAAISENTTLSIFSDWVHLTMTGLWVGGLVALVVASFALRGLTQPVAPQLGTLVAHFSNLARVAVVGLVVTGIYATWHLVNSLAGLTTTFYGRLLLLKLALAAGMMLVAGVNLVWTQRRLLAGERVWVGRLVALVSVEILLALGILLLVGAMTAISPARNEMVQHAAAAAILPAPEPRPIHLSEEVDGIVIHFTATPGWVGENGFVVQLLDEAGEPIPDASLIRMRFEHQTENLGESEVQIRPEGEAADGVYTAEGANLSAVGDWRVRMTVQRPDEFDSIADFEFAVIAPPPPPPAPVVEVEPVSPYQRPLYLLLGFPVLLIGALFLVQARLRVWQGMGLAAVLLVVLGLAFVVSAMLPVP